MRISVIIPTLNESGNIDRLINQLSENGGDGLEEILVVDGGSEDSTVRIARELGASVLESPKRGRAVQMNYGASIARGDVLYFVHGDTLPPASYMDDISKSMEMGFPTGCYRYSFDSPKKLLKINAWFTRFDFRWCRGGDQSLFIPTHLFKQLNGFREDHKIMEDFEFIERLRKHHAFRIIPKNMLVSARKYDDNSYLRVQLANLIVFNMYRLGYPQNKMVSTYRRWLNYR